MTCQALSNPAAMMSLLLCTAALFSLAHAEEAAGDGNAPPKRKSSKFSLVSNILEDLGFTQSQKLILAMCLCAFMIWTKYRSTTARARAAKGK